MELRRLLYEVAVDVWRNMVSIVGIYKTCFPEASGPEIVYTINAESDFFLLLRHASKRRRSAVFPCPLEPYHETSMASPLVMENVTPPSSPMKRFSNAATNSTLRRGS